jgi:NADPH:quinone reductase-like Zn-dependent oxidoreductase
MPRCGAGELLVRHDACGLCFSDIKIIAQGEKHPRIFRDMRKEPVVMGHEVAITVMEVGAELRGQYRRGDRFIIQADIYDKGVNYAYGYMIQGGLSEYGILDRRVLDGDGGNYLIPLRPGTGYAESGLAEPWACVVAAYTLRYRGGLKAGGTAWFIGTVGALPDYKLSAGFDAQGHPARLWLTNVPPKFARTLETRAKRRGV